MESVIPSIIGVCCVAWSVLIFVGSWEQRHVRGLGFSSIAILTGSIAIFDSVVDGAISFPSMFLLGISLGLSLFMAALFVYSHMTEPVDSPSEGTPEEPPKEETEEPVFKHPSIPEDMRTEHALVVARSGHGKTQLLQSLIYDDLEKDATVIVIDSQPQLIRTLVNVVPFNRLVWIDPTSDDYSLALNLFDKDQDPSLYEYIFSALEAEMTSKQAVTYRYLARLVSLIPSGNIMTMYDILQAPNLDQWSAYISKLPPIPESFMRREFMHKDFKDTKFQIGRRIVTLLENTHFQKMFAASDMRLNINKEMLEGKVILIDTAKRTLRGAAYKVFGRFFLAQITQAIFSRDHPFKHRVYIYIDEFQEYANDPEFIAELFTQARKFNVSVTVAFQYIDQLPDSVRSAVMSNTAAKFFGSLSTPDRRIMAAELDVPPNSYIMRNIPKGKFVFLPRGVGDRLVEVELGRLENMPSRSTREVNSIKDKMSERYGQVESEVFEAPDSDDFDDFKDAD